MERDKDEYLDPKEKAEIAENISIPEVITGKQTPHPAHEYGTVSPPPQNYPHTEARVPEAKGEIELKTAPADWRFPVQNQTRHCYTRFIEYHRCIKAKGKDDPACDKFARYYRSLCPIDWIERWNEQIEEGRFPGPI